MNAIALPVPLHIRGLDCFRRHERVHWRIADANTRRAHVRYCDDLRCRTQVGVGEPNPERRFDATMVLARPTRHAPPLTGRDVPFHAQ